MDPIENIILNGSLYEKFENLGGLEFIYQLRHFSGTLDYYCPKCQKGSTFKCENKYPSDRNGFDLSTYEVTIIPDI